MFTVSNEFPIHYSDNELSFEVGENERILFERWNCFQ